MCHSFPLYGFPPEDPLFPLQSALRSAFSDPQGALKTRGDAFPGDLLPALLIRDGAFALAPMTWGYPGYPSRRAPQAKPKALINAKAETAATLKTWRDSLSARRAALPASGFYEWGASPPKGRKRKFLLTLPGGERLFLAAIFAFGAPETAKAFPHFALLTTAAGASSADIHPRAPVVLRESEILPWLKRGDPALFDPARIALVREEILPAGGLF
ncbi:MAG: SOS response-associated peptidase [Deltaproteobacteria bacterium]|jgi:putative SOS response-associated peptidase YedK|nr:SOS response-associated peptidase [Deltaproteobacteria bacterium]